MFSEPCCHARICPFFSTTSTGLTLGKSIDALLDAKTASGRRPKSVNALRLYLRAFARGREDMLLNRIGIEEIDAWRNSRQEKLSTWASNRYRLSALFSFAIRRGWINDNPCKRLESILVDHSPPKIFTVEQCRTSLNFVRQRIPRFVAWLALALFAGVRPEELDRLTWRDVDLDAGKVTIDAAASKVRRRRVTPLAPAAIAWLKFGGDLPIPAVSRRRYIRRTRKRLGLAAWPHDVLRHTAASMMLVREQDAGKVAMWLGNSPRILLSHYHQLVPENECQEFWELFPFSPTITANG
jgi:integrase